jgi:hypothetical protein
MHTLRRNPYGDVEWESIQYHSAQLHAHTGHPPVDGHSGQDPPGQVIDDYHGAGYSVLSLTDHEYAIDEQIWPWTDWDRDPTALDMVALQGVELGGSEDGLEHDLLVYGADVTDTSGESVDDVLTRVGDAGGLAVFPHPSRYEETPEWYAAHFRAHPHLLGVEVVNAADRYPTARDVWDAVMLELGAERPVWGFANDDFHGRDAGYTFDRSHTVLLLDELTEAAVRSALVEGRFLYQHEVEADPPSVDAIRHDPDREELTVEASGATKLQWISRGEIVETGPTIDYESGASVGATLRARLVADDGSETGTQPFLFD